MAHHSFDYTQACHYGITCAIVLKYCADRTRSSGPKNIRKGKPWFYNTIEEIGEQYPYLSPSGLAAVLKRLRDFNVLETGVFNYWRADKTLWYSVPQPFRDAAEEKPFVFDTDIATAHGIPEAVLYHNFCFQLTHKPDGELDHSMSPAHLHTLMPFLSVPTIKRSLKNLVTANLIVKTSKTKPLYALPAT